ncbi:MAG: VOC family protein [Porphyrobacter sp.]|nr:VOC family protein [Porphyrobacter sp.]
MATARSSSEARRFSQVCDARGQGTLATMIVQRLDHVNIITDRLAETARFYAELLDLEERDGPPPLPPHQVRWMYDAGGQAILHINSLDCPRAFDREVVPGAETGAIHHVALRCGEFDEVKARLDRQGADYRVNDLSSIGLRQIFAADPNNVLLELNFFST